MGEDADYYREEAIVAWKTRPPDELPVGIFLQDKIWVTGDKEIMNVEDIEDGHLENLIAWMERHKGLIISMINTKLSQKHMATWRWPLLIKLQTLQKQRDSAEAIIARAGTVDPAKLIRELDKRGYEIKKKPATRTRKGANHSPSSDAYRDY